MIRLRVPRSLYAQVALLYLLLLIGFSLVAVGVVTREFDAFIEELEQRLNYDLARHLASEIRPALKGGFATPRATDAVERLRSINPAVDIYLLHHDGSIAAAYGGSNPPVRSSIEMEPIRKFLAVRPMLPIRAEDPATDTGTKVFSAAPMVFPGFDGFVFIILRGQPLEMAAEMLRNSYIIRGTSLVLISVLVCTVIAGLLAFSLLTRRFRRLTEGVRQFQSGVYGHRIRITLNDEIGQLTQAINAMAATIDAQLRTLRQMDTERRGMIARVSHDLRTPLTSLRGHIERLAYKMLAVDDSSSTRSTLAVLSRNADQLEQLADRLASLANFDDDAEPDMERFSLAELAQDVVVAYEAAASSRAVTLETRFVPDIPFVLGDIRLLEHAITLLLENAVRQTPAGSVVTVALEPADNEGVRLSVSFPSIRQRASSDELADARNAECGMATARHIIAKHGAILDVSFAVGGTVCVTCKLK